ncbi:LOW QUALITY PROTEIN: testis-expressed protein 13B [Molossus nigricans]
MALSPQDPSGGFQHGNVVAFINQKMARNIKGPEFYLQNISCSWVEVEDKLRAILEDSMMTSEAKEACACSLALGMRFARKQGQLHACRMPWLQLHKSASQALASNMKELTVQHEMEHKKAAYQQQLTLAKLAEVQKEKELLRWKLLQAEMRSSWEWQQVAEEPGLATTCVFGTKRAGEEKNKVGAAPPTTTATGAAGRTGRHKGVERVEGAKAAKELDGGLLQLHGAVEQKTPMGPSAVGAQGIDPLEPQRDKTAFKPQQPRRPPPSCRPWNWKCLWCNLVNFSGREICLLGRDIWLQNP